MFSIKSAVTGLGLTLSVFSVVYADNSSDRRLAAVKVLALSHNCRALYPGVAGGVENLMVSDVSIDEATKTEVRRIGNDPRYKLQIDSMAYTYANSPEAYKLKTLCQNYVSK